MAKLVNQTIFASRLKSKGLLLFGAGDVQIIFNLSKVATASLLHRYKKRGFISQPRRGLYVFPDALPMDFFFANKAYGPSYISLETALSYHGIIPETVYEVTSVTPKATRHFEAMGKIFSYHKIKKIAYRGYQIKKQQRTSFYIADAEKAFVDTNYLRLVNGEGPISRFNKEKINTKKALGYARLFESPRLELVIRKILK
ncbi:MAG: hypothetical protein A2749_02905 [Parcubacteria group bacterium RIFCSPHIGHO2_01_FULL_45_26]|nr:MAG: hypothetical protein A2749_02905 [Parcubacteria group bacterium RIFCSPHIGHO2_01_FULL_45_26]